MVVTGRSKSPVRWKALPKMTVVIERGDRNNHPDICPLGLSGDQNGLSGWHPSLSFESLISLNCCIFWPPRVLIEKSQIIRLETILTSSIFWYHCWSIVDYLEIFLQCPSFLFVNTWLAIWSKSSSASSLASLDSF